MLKEENNELLKELNAVLESMPNEDWDGVKVVTSGIITDNEGLLEVFDNYKVCIVADDVFRPIFCSIIGRIFSF